MIFVCTEVNELLGYKVIDVRIWNLVLIIWYFYRICTQFITYQFMLFPLL